MNEMRGDDAPSSHGKDNPNANKVSPPAGGVETNRVRDNVSSLRPNNVEGPGVDFSPPKNISKRSNANKNVVLTANVVTVAKDNNAIARDKTTHKMVRVLFCLTCFLKLVDCYDLLSSCMYLLRTWSTTGFGQCLDTRNALPNLAYS
jgi:hypothetical protein